MALALAGAAAAVAARWYAGRVDELGRRREFPLVSVVLVVVLAAGAATPGVLRARQERRLAAVASALGGRPVAVRCRAFGGAFVDAGVELGYVRWRPDGTPEGWTLLKREACRDLAAYVRAGGRRPSRAQVIAGHTDESVAECAAVQRDARTARLADGLSADAGRLPVRHLPAGRRHGRAPPGCSLDAGRPVRPGAVDGSVAGPPRLCYKSEP